MGRFVTFALWAFAVAMVYAQEKGPSMLSLAFAGPGGMSVWWYTPTPANDSPVARWGLEPNDLFNGVYATNKSYGTGFFHVAKMTNLKPETKYFYQVGDTTNGWSDIRSFVTAPEPGTVCPFTFAVVGDMGVINSEDTISLMSQRIDTYSFVLHVGDISYADDFYLKKVKHPHSYEGVWNQYQIAMEPLTSHVQYMVLPGNHEANCNEVAPFLCPDHERNFTAYRYRFHMPYLESGSVNNMWYSFDYGNVHFIQISTETDFNKAPMGSSYFLGPTGPFGDQITWLKNDLAKAVANRKAVPWIIVSGHRPLYTIAAGACDACRDVFEPLFLEHAVDVYLCGHVHWYERTWPVGKGGLSTQRNYTSPSAPVHLISGAGGNVEGLTKGRVHKKKPLPSFYANVQRKTFGFGEMHVDGNSLTWSFFSAKDGEVLDQIVITK